MMGKASRADGGMFTGMPKPLDTSLLNFISHHGIKKVNEIISTLGDCTTAETREAFGKMINDFNSKPLEVVEDENEDPDQDLQDDEDEDVDEGEEDQDLDEGEEDEDEDEDEAAGKASKLFADTERGSLVKRLHAPVGDELEPKKPKTAKSSCIPGDETEAAGINNSSLQGLMKDKETSRQQ